MDEIPLPGDIPVPDDQASAVAADQKPEMQEHPPPPEAVNEAATKANADNTNPLPPESQENVVPQELEIPQDTKQSAVADSAEAEKEQAKNMNDQPSEPREMIENRPDVPVPGANGFMLCQWRS